MAVLLTQIYTKILPYQTKYAKIYKVNEYRLLNWQRVSITALNNENNWQKKEMLLNSIFFIVHIKHINVDVFGLF